jgi:hypothetical protein
VRGSHRLADGVVERLTEVRYRKRGLITVIEMDMPSQEAVATKARHEAAKAERLASRRARALHRRAQGYWPPSSLVPCAGAFSPGLYVSEPRAHSQRSRSESWHELNFICHYEGNNNVVVLCGL